MMKKSKYSEYFEKCVNRKATIIFVTLILCSVALIGCSGSDKAVSFLLQEESAVNDIGIERIITDNEAIGLTAGSDATDDTEDTDNTESQYANKTEPETEKQSLEPVCVHVCGAVISPGVVEVAVDSRVEDALLAAGGFREDAAIDYVNLAAKVEDGQKVYFPTREEVEALATENGSLVTLEAESNLKQSVQEQNGKVNINTAGVELLCTLPGIGEARAQAIIDYREANGAFQNVEGIMQVPGIKQNAYEKLRDKITVN